MNDGSRVPALVGVPAKAGTRTDVRSPLDVERRTIIIQGLTLTDQIVG